MNECGECTLCCKLVGVEELRKPTCVWCKHVSNKAPRGCQIYNDRPQSCRNFACAWLEHNLPAELRPDRIHIVIAGQIDELQATMVHVDPSYPDAVDTKLAQRLLNACKKALTYPDLIVNVGKKRYIVTDNPAAIKRIGDKIKTMPTITFE